MSQVVIVLAVFRPNQDFLADQLASIAAQSHDTFHTIAVIADTTSTDLVAKAAKAAGLEITLHTAEEPLGAVAAFETGLRVGLAAFPNAQFFAFADQDDVWRSDRIAAGLEALKRSGAGLVHSDARLIDAEGQLISPSVFWSEGRLRRSGPRDLLRRNNVTGMTSLFTRDVAETALPFPRQYGTHYYHDLWLALIAAGTKGTLHLRQRLVDYRQHSTNAVGAALGGSGPRGGFRTRLKELCGAYGLARYLGTAAAQRTGNRAAYGGYAASDDFAVRHFLDAAGHLLLARPRAAKFALGHGAVAAGRLGWMLRDMAWQGPARARMAFDSRLFALSPGVTPDQAFDTQPTPITTHGPQAHAALKPAAPKAWWTYFDPRTQAKWRPSFTAGVPRVTLLIPSLNPNEMFAGIATAVDIGLGLAARGVPVRFVATDLPLASTIATRAFLARRTTAILDQDMVELACGVTSKTLPAHPDDHLLATAWWTAHVAEDLLGGNLYTRERFTYLIQDYEPGFYPWGDEYAGALASYDLAYDSIVNTSLLHDYVVSQGHSLDAPIVFHPAIDTGRYAALPRTPAGTRRHIAVYGRPEVARNMFHTSIQAVGRAIEALGLTPEEVRVSSVGLKHDHILLPNGVPLLSRGKIAWDDYPAFLASVDIGVALMLSPHPSHLPIEMAAAGARVVTNRFGSKDLATLSPAILSTDPSVPALTQAIVAAWDHGGVPDRDRAINLRALGVPLDRAIDLLAARLRLTPSTDTSTEAA